MPKTPTPGQEIKRRVIAAATRELEEIAKDALERAQARISISPVTDDPDPAVSLRESGRVGEVHRRGDRITIRLGFHPAYAAAQHEGHMSYVREEVTGEASGGRIFWEVHKHPGGGQTKFLESVIKEMAREYNERLAAAIKRELGG